jgi:hypothetical protein
MWLSLLGMAIKTGAEVYKNKKESEALESQAKKLHYEKMARGEIEYTGKALDAQKGDWKDEFILVVLSSPLALLAYSVFADDPALEKKLDLYFEKLQNMPWWVTGLWISVVAAVYGIKATDIINTKKGK